MSSFITCLQIEVACAHGSKISDVIHHFIIYYYSKDTSGYLLLILQVLAKPRHSRAFLNLQVNQLTDSPRTHAINYTYIFGPRQSQKKTDSRDVILDSSDLQQSGPSSKCAGVVVSHEILTV